MKEILDTLRACMREKYGLIQADDECVRRMAEAGQRHLSDDSKEILDMALTLEELQRAVNKGGNKGRGRDGINLEFLKATWENVER
jgi:hypothetical protein